MRSSLCAALAAPGLEDFDVAGVSFDMCWLCRARESGLEDTTSLGRARKSEQLDVNLLLAVPLLNEAANHANKEDQPNDE